MPSGGPGGRWRAARGGHRHPPRSVPSLPTPDIRTCRDPTASDKRRALFAAYAAARQPRKDRRKVKLAGPRALDKEAIEVRQHQSRPVSRAGSPASGKPCGHCALSMIVVSSAPGPGSWPPDSADQAARAGGWLTISILGRGRKGAQGTDNGPQRSYRHRLTGPPKRPGPALQPCTCPVPRQHCGHRSLRSERAVAAASEQLGPGTTPGSPRRCASDRGDPAEHQPATWTRRLRDGPLVLPPHWRSPPLGMCPIGDTLSYKHEQGGAPKWPRPQ